MSRAIPPNRHTVVDRDDLVLLLAIPIAERTGDEVVTAVAPLASLESGLRRVEILTDATGLVAVVKERGEESVRLRLGISVGGRTLTRAPEVVRATQGDVVESVAPLSGKTTMRRTRTHRQLTTTFVETDGFEWAVVIRVAEDGVALRYEIPDLWGVSTLDAEHTALELSPFDRAWMLDYQTWYETPRFGGSVDTLRPGDYGFPALLRARDGRDYVLMTESGIDGRYSGAHGVINDERTLLTVRSADAALEIARGPVTPWRVLILGELPTIVESTFVDELAPAQHPSLTDTSWIRPGRAAWSWWSDFYSGAQLDAQKHFVDEAARLGWEHLLIDCGWEQTWVPEIVSYASRYGIQVHLWCVWHDLDGPEKLQRLALWKSWGVAGIKVDFMESESKDRYRWYDTILEESARQRLMVNFHGSVIPRGWARTWPHVLSYEAIRGSEYYVFYQDTPLTAEHNVIQPFTRNVVGAMDYTPVAFSAPGRTTSDAHELALAIAFESGITHFADSVDAYAARPAAARLLAEIPPRWDETVLLAGTPDTEAVIARRSDDRWFIGAIAAGPARRVRVPLERLGATARSAWVVTDAPGGGLATSEVEVDTLLEVDIADDGGFAAVVAPAGAALFRARSRAERETPRVEQAVVDVDIDGRAELTVDPTAALRVPPRWHAEALGGGRWDVRAPVDLAPGRAGVIMVEVPGVEGVPLLTPVRAVRVLSGSHALSSLPMLAFGNESGPVERDMSNGGGNPRDGRRMSVAGAEHAIGLGMSSPAHAHFHLGGRGHRLIGAVGIDDETPGTAAIAVVELDAREVFRAAVTAGSAPVAFDLDVSGARILTIRTLPQGAEPGHVDWIAPVVHSTRP